MTLANDDVTKALSQHDETLTHRGHKIWLGAEPTYTDRWKETPEWLFEALGNDKRSRAEGMLARLARETEGSVILRSVGRQYDGEDTPRWSLGLYSRRDGSPIWTGPPDPVLIENDGPTSPTPKELAQALVHALQERDLSAELVSEPYQDRVVFRSDHEVPLTDIRQESLLGRKTVNSHQIEGVEAVDELSQNGTYLLICLEQDGVLQVELPGMSDVKLFLQVLDALSRAANQTNVPAMIISGYPPPIDETIAWTTLTPDPGVVEVNMAPSTGTVGLLHHLRRLERVAAEEGLTSYRLQYNGQESDSGGGGQITFGSSSPTNSPFLNDPGLLPRLVRYFNRHPSLSYLYASDSVGPGSQAPRVDEGVPGSMQELSLALELLDRVSDPEPETIWATLAQFLVDASGNAHRAEFNIEKLWNFYLGNRGRQGLVEFRAFRMEPSPESTAAVAALLRSIVAMLSDSPCTEPLINWGGILHDRFSLPFFLHQDLSHVLTQLDHAGYGLGTPLLNYLYRDQDYLFIEQDLGQFRLQIRRAIEYWPLVGDSSQQSGGSRLIDASTSRIEIRLLAEESSDGIDLWKCSVGDWSFPLRQVGNSNESVQIIGLRYRSFIPQFGLHPTLPSQAPLTLMLSHPRDGSWRVEIHNWHPEGLAYPGLPASFEEARQRRADRCLINKIEEMRSPESTPPPEAVGEYVLDLRWMYSKS